MILIEKATSRVAQPPSTFENLTTTPLWKLLHVEYLHTSASCSHHHPAQHIIFLYLPLSIIFTASDREEESYGSAPVYAVGPLIRVAGPPASRSQLLDWLDEQPVESVLYISFRSLGVLLAQPITELALGLELSRQRFMWVTCSLGVSKITGKSKFPRPPSKKIASADTGDNALNYLPNGFLERTHSLVLVFTQWAPQSEILGHRSLGGFLSHCGWNSSLESMLSSVLMITWPLYAKQKMNATKLAKEVGVAVRPKIAPTKRVVGREEIQIMVRKVMEEPEGKAMRARVKELKISGKKALTPSGSSFNAVSQIGKANARK
ncbi:anthocyanidin 3-O-glucosyltransferase 5-like [Corylus avellana]|uniref:anthocyanidin 3-O-glucosyltransferase 5-like n=1 Tax=Corylus avellana TaxID=13451 RepID=UPI00286BDA27|nr:anthocyanidin 3-O-glucosyltransferase 5-like [Corylus avellana]